MMRNLTTAAEGNTQTEMEWNPYRSKWKAAEKKGLDVSVKGNVLYLGASSGTTVGQIAKLTEGTIFAVEISPKMAIRLVRLAERNSNIAPIFADARDIEKIKKSMFKTKADILFQDIPSTDQVNILVNASKLVDKDCRIFLSLKTQSISQKNPDKTMLEVKKKLEDFFVVKNVVNLEPYHKKHYFFVLGKK